IVVFIFYFYCCSCYIFFFFFFSSRRRHTRFDCDWSSDVCSSDLPAGFQSVQHPAHLALWVVRCSPLFRTLLPRQLRSLALVARSRLVWRCCQQVQSPQLLPNENPWPKR